jgi:hypothetical protein
VELQDNRSDAPLIPIAAIEKLHQVRPDLVDWVFNETQTEAHARRAEQSRINRFVFIERMAGMLCAAAIGVVGVGGGIYAALQGHDWLGGIVASVTIGTLAVSFLHRSRSGN